MEIRVRNNAGAVPGDVVELELQPGDVLYAALIIYGLPLLGGLLAFILGSVVAGGVYKVAFALAGFALSFPVIYALDKRATGQSRFQPVIVAVERQATS